MIHHPVKKIIKRDSPLARYSDGLIKAFQAGLEFGTHYKQSGWGQGLTILTGMMNISRFLNLENKPYALYHGLSAVAQDCVSIPPRFQVSSLPDPWPDLSTIKTLVQTIY